MHISVKAVKEVVNVEVKKMHSKGLVHGDLRDINILYCRRGGCDSALLIDWDWRRWEGLISGINIHRQSHTNVGPFGPGFTMHRIGLHRLVRPVVLKGLGERKNIHHRTQTSTTNTFLKIMIWQVCNMYF